MRSQLHMAVLYHGNALNEEVMDRKLHFVSSIADSRGEWLNPASITVCSSKAPTDHQVQCDCCGSMITSAELLA